MNPLAPSEIMTRLRAAGPGATVFLVGAGGCGMSGLGHLLLDLGHRVAGSDLVLNVEARQLQARGAEIFLGHDAAHVRRVRPVMLAYSSAVRRDNPELEAAESLGVPIVRRAVLLSGLMLSATGLGVAGMHGKTTTSAWLAFALEQLGAGPGYAIGALVPQLPRHARIAACGASRTLSSPPQDAARGLCIHADAGSGEDGGASAPHVPPFFVAELDESDGSLREFAPAHLLLLNIDAEHLDFYASLDEIGREFAALAARTSGHVLFCADDERLPDLLAAHPRAVSYGFHPLAAYRIEMPAMEPTPSFREAGRRETPFRVFCRGQLLGEFGTRLLGEKNVLNAGGVIALLHLLGFEPAAMREAVAGFAGAARRQETLFADHRFRVLDDYGHHPAEIRATLRAVRSLGARRLLVAFQPHRFTRTRHLLNEFATAFHGADRLWLAEVYAASEPPIPGVNSRLLAGAIQARGQDATFVPGLVELRAAVRAAMQPGDAVLFLGAGADITVVAHALADQLRAETVPSIESLHADLAAVLGRETVLRRDEPLKKRTTLRIGGRADVYVEPANERELAGVLRQCARRGTPFMILGRGSNLLVRDGGIRGVVISLAHPDFSRVEIENERVRCGAGAKLKAVAVEARRHELAGLEFLEGIPGSVGGALRMNAGAMGAWMFDVVERVRFMSFEGEVFERAAGEVAVEYRGCPLLKTHVALGAVLQGVRAAPETVRERMDLFSRKRWESQPNQPSAGCIFKNPAAIPAGRLIDELGLKGTRVGGAKVSEVHGNFIVNEGEATAEDVLNLIRLIQTKAQSERGIDLRTEVEIVGEDL